MSKAGKFLIETITELNAMNVSGGVHPPEGYPKIEIPSKISNLISRKTNGKITKVIKYDDYWMVQVSKFEARGQDFKDLISGGLSGVRVDVAGEVALYFDKIK